MNTSLNCSNYAWLAGFWQGEGSIHASAKGIVLNCSQTEVYPLDMCRWILGAGAVTGPYKNGTKGHKPLYQFTVANFEEVQMAVVLMWPWLSPRRKAQAKTALLRHIASCHQRAERNRFCKRGHARITENQLFHKNGKRQCRLCVRQLQRERYHAA